MVQQRGTRGDGWIGYPRHPRLYNQHVFRSRQKEQGWENFDDAPGCWLRAWKLHCATFGVLGGFRVPTGRLPRLVRLVRWQRASDGAHDHEPKVKAKTCRGGLC